MSWQYRGINEITPKDANWNYCGMKIFDLSVEGTHQIIFDNFEGILLSLSAENVAVTVDQVEFKLQGRTGVLRVFQIGYTYQSVQVLKY